jgi:hypothetical protein
MNLRRKAIHGVLVRAASVASAPVAQVRLADVKKVK